MAALGHCRESHREAPGSPSDRTGTELWSIFPHVLLCRLRDPHPALLRSPCSEISDLGHQAPARSTTGTPQQGPARTSWLRSRSPSQTWLLHFLPASITPHQDQSDLFLLRMTPTPGSSSEQCPHPSTPKGKHKGEVGRKPQHTQVRKCKVSTKASFLFLPEHSFSSHTVDASPSLFEVLTQWE